MFYKLVSLEGLRCNTNLPPERSKFEAECNKMLAAGWTPLGGVSIAVMDDTYSYHQAFIKQ